MGKLADEILQLSPDEFARWLAYFKLQQEDQEKALAQARSGGGNRGKRGRR